MVHDICQTLQSVFIYILQRAYLLKVLKGICNLNKKKYTKYICIWLISPISAAFLTKDQLEPRKVMLNDSQLKWCCSMQERTWIWSLQMAVAILKPSAVPQAFMWHKCTLILKCFCFELVHPVRGHIGINLLTEVLFILSCYLRCFSSLSRHLADFTSASFHRLQNAPIVTCFNRP